MKRDDMVYITLSKQSWPLSTAHHWRMQRNTVMYIAVVRVHGPPKIVLRRRKNNKMCDGCDQEAQLVTSTSGLWISMS